MDGNCVGAEQWGFYSERLFEEFSNVSLHYSLRDHRLLHISRLPLTFTSVPYLNEIFSFDFVLHRLDEVTAEFFT